MGSVFWQQRFYRDNMMSKDFDRREFARRLTLGAAAAMPVAGATAIVGADHEEKDKKKPVEPAELLLELVKQKYPEHLDEPRLALIRKDIDGILARSKALSGFPLDNSDEPAFVFSAYRSDGV